PALLRHLVRPAPRHRRTRRADAPVRPRGAHRPDPAPGGSTTVTVAPAPPRPETPGPDAPATGKPPRRRRSRRWLRLVVPFAVVLTLIVATAVIHALAEPDVTDRQFLNPTSSAPIGGQRLADLLARRGVTIERVERSSDALVRAYQGNVTLFVPAP